MNPITLYVLEKEAGVISRSRDAVNSVRRGIRDFRATSGTQRLKNKASDAFDDYKFKNRSDISSLDKAITSKAKDTYSSAKKKLKDTAESVKSKFRRKPPKTRMEKLKDFASDNKGSLALSAGAGVGTGAFALELNKRRKQRQSR